MHYSWTCAKTSQQQVERGGGGGWGRLPERYILKLNKLDLSYINYIQQQRYSFFVLSALKLSSSDLLVIKTFLNKMAKNAFLHAGASKM